MVKVQPAIPPQNFQQAVEFGLCIGPMSDVLPRTTEIATVFLAQKFGDAMADHLKKGNVEVYQALAQLWKDVNINAAETIENQRSRGPRSSEGKKVSVLSKVE